LLLLACLVVVQKTINIHSYVIDLTAPRLSDKNNILIELSWIMTLTLQHRLCYLTELNQH